MMENPLLHWRRPKLGLTTFQGVLPVVALRVVAVVAEVAVAGTVVEPTVELTSDTWASCTGSNDFNIPNNVSITPAKTLFTEPTIASTLLQSWYGLLYYAILISQTGLVIFFQPT